MVKTRILGCKVTRVGSRRDQRSGATMRSDEINNSIMVRQGSFGDNKSDIVAADVLSEAIALKILYREIVKMKKNLLDK